MLRHVVAIEVLTQVGASVNIFDGLPRGTSSSVHRLFSCCQFPAWACLTENMRVTLGVLRVFF